MPNPILDTVNIDGTTYDIADTQARTALSSVPSNIVTSVNGESGTVVVSKIQTTAGSNNTEYNLIGTATSNTNNAAVNVYNPTLISFSKYDSNFARLTLGSTATPGQIRLYTSASGASGYTDLKSAATSTNTRTITFPDATGTVALTSDIPAVQSWALAANKPSYTFSELTSHPTSVSGYGITDAYTKTEVDGMVSGVLHYKGTKATISALPSSGNTTGDVWHITADGSEYAWDGSAWQELGTATDLSGYVPTSTKVNNKALSGDITLTASDVGALPSSTTYVSSFNGDTGAITYTAPVTSVNGQTGAVTLTIPDADDHKWNTLELNQSYGASNNNYYIPAVESGAVTDTTARMALATTSPTANAIPKYNVQKYLISTTPSANDNSTKVATTAYVDAVIPSVPSWAMQSTKPTYTASEVGAAESSHTHTSMSSSAGNGAVSSTVSVSTIGTALTYDGDQSGTSGITLRGNQITLDTRPGSGQNTQSTLTISGGQISGLATPTTDTMAATKKYVDDTVAAVADTNTTYTISISGNVITLTPSSGQAQTITLPVYNGGVS